MICANEPARPQFGRRGLGGRESSAPEISCVAGSSQGHAICRSTTTSWVLGPAADRSCFKIVTQYSSAQSWRILHRRKTARSPSRGGCGSKKLWAGEPRILALVSGECKDGMRRTLQLHASRVECDGHVFLPILQERPCQEEVYMEAELMCIVPHWHPRSQLRDLAQRSKGLGGDEQVLMTASQHHLQHR